MSNWRTSREYREWRANVIRRDGRCVICGSLQGRQAHHIKDGSCHPESRFDVSNGVTLCGGSMNSCHTQFHCNFKNSFKEKCDDGDWANFISLINYIKGLE